MGWKVDGVEMSEAEAMDKLRSIPGGEEERKRLLALQAEMAGNFANLSESGVNRLGQESQAQRDYMGKVARGEISVSGEQLRQGLQQNVAAQRSMAAGAAPQNAAMAARTAAMQSARMGSGMSGQAALAGMQERDAAQRALSQMILTQRGQDMQGALGSRQNAMEGYRPPPPQQPGKSTNEQLMQAAATAAQLYAISDRRLKTDIEDGDEKARRTMEGLRAYTFRYKDSKHGKGEQLGILAQDLRKNGLGHTVTEDGEGLKVDGAKLAASLAAMMPGLADRVSKLEDKKPTARDDERTRAGLRAIANRQGNSRS